MGAWIFTGCVLLIGYAYLGYPALVWLLARAFGRRLQHVQRSPRAVSIVVAAANEARHVVRRTTELLSLLSQLDPASELIIVSDGSTDGTDRLARQVGHPQLHVIQLPRNMGKAVALNTGVAAAQNPIIVFADARQHWAPDAILRMLRNYTDPSVGAVSGDLVLENHDGSLAGVGLYWKLEKLIRRSESRLYSSVQVSGSICSVRRELYDPLPGGIILDDVCWPLGVSMCGYRVIHEPRAHAFDRLPENPRDEFRRKVRTLSGNFQLLRFRPEALLPWRNPIWFALICHKLLRLLVPWAMAGALLASALSPQPWMHWMLGLQVAGYALGVAGIAWPVLGRNRLANAIASLLVLNSAAAVAWFVFAMGRTGTSWKKVSYRADGHQVPAGPQGVG